MVHPGILQSGTSGASPKEFDLDTLRIPAAYRSRVAVLYAEATPLWDNPFVTPLKVSHAARTLVPIGTYSFTGGDRTSHRIMWKSRNHLLFEIRTTSGSECAALWQRGSLRLDR
jgi:hypothetical protein